MKGSALLLSVAPMKALCSERFEDWNGRFGAVGLKCLELTGDSMMYDYSELHDVHIILTTPVSSFPHKLASPGLKLIHSAFLTSYWKTCFRNRYVHVHWATTWSVISRCHRVGQQYVHSSKGLIRHQNSTVYTCSELVAFKWGSRDSIHTKSKHILSLWWL